MAQMTVKQLADEVGIPVERLLTQLGQAGVEAEGAEQPISDEDKAQLLKHLRSARTEAVGAGENGSSSRISLRRRSTSELKLGGRRGAGGRTVSVEVRKRRTYAKRGEEQAARPESEKETEAQESARREAEQQAAREAEEAARRSREQAEEEARLKVEAERKESEATSEQGRAQESEVQTQEEPEQDTEPEAASEDDEQEAAPSADELDEAPAPEPEQASEQDEQSSAAGEATTEEPGPVDEGRRRMRAMRRRAQENLRRAAEKREHEPEERQEEESAAARSRLHVAKGKSGRRKKKARPAYGTVKMETRHGFERPTQPVVREVAIPEAISVGELAQKMAVKSSELIKNLMKMGVMATINQTIDQETAVLIVEEMGHKARPIHEADAEDRLLQEASERAEAAAGEPRPPVVTIMGHVDHGKTSLLDYIRKTKVTAGESGGITQHIGAYHVETETGVVSFLDTPGHAAFTQMRARGADITDIVILVVAADDGVMPQTKEAIQHARAAGVPIVVAITKVDKEQADVERVKSELSAEDIIPEDWGGDTQFVNVSSVSGEGVEDLLESVILQAEVMELAAPVDVPANGIVVESRLEKGRGPVATVLVKAGALRQGDMMLSGRFFGRVRALFNERGETIEAVTPSLPAEVLGLSGAPNAGDEVVVVENERRAREVAGLREDKIRENRLAQQRAARLEEVFSEMESGEAQVLNVLIKADVQGSVEALAESLQNLSSEDIRVRIVGRGVGGISGSDVDLALASDAIVIGFNVRADGKARKNIQASGVDVRYYSVIYNVIEDIKDAASGLLGVETRENILGLAQVLDVFRSSRLGAIAGCLVEEGEVRRGQPIRVLRDNVVIYEGELESLRRHKDDVDKVSAGTECGIGVKNYNDVKAGDQIENFERIEVQRTL
jgi:translation initiation factor IF-2